MIRALLATWLSEFVTVEQAALLTGRHYRTILRNVQSGGLDAYVTPGGEYFIYMEDLRAWHGARLGDSSEVVNKL
ncbi:MAG: excisionase family DNA-binding protein [bacterium]